MSLPGFRSLQPLASTGGYDGFVGFSEEAGRELKVSVPRPDAVSDPRVAQTFIDVARSAVLLHHPNIERTLGVAKLRDGRWSVTAEPVPGETLAEYVAKRGPLSGEEAVALALQLSKTVAHAHEHGVTHGALCPEAIVLVGGLEAFAPCITGFATGVLGRLRPGFSAPEAEAGAQPSAEEDLYSLGALLFFTLTGHSVGRGALPQSAHDVGPIVQRCLEKDPKRRYPSAAELVKALSRADGTMVSSSGPHPIPLTQTNPLAISAASADDVVGRMLGPYQIVDLLGEGSMGRVFLAKHTLLGRHVAIKVLRPDQYKQADLVQRFFQEARTVNQINHEHIVEIIDFVQEQGPDGPSLVYCVMELLKGESLSALVDRGPVTLQRSIHIVRQICEALAAAHRVGVVHRDIKPDNIFLIERAGQRDYVKVLDFGVAKLTVAHADAPLVSTMDGTIIGTPICMAPEQAAGQPVDARADVYAVGVILYLLCSGRLPFEAKNFGALAAKIITEPPPPLPATTPGGQPLSHALSRVVMQCLEKDPGQRPQSMEALRDALTRTDSEPTLSLPAAKVAPPAKPGPSKSSSRAVPIAIALVAMVAAAAGVGVVMLKAKSEVVVPPPPILSPVLPPEPAVVVAPPEPKPEPVSPAPVEPEPTEPSEPTPPKPTVSPKLAPAGPLTKEAIAKGLSAGRSKVSSCIERHRADLKAPSGKLQVQFTIEPTGAVSSPRLANGELQGSKLEQCIVKEVQRFKFTRHTGPARAVTVPFDYAARGD